jgi:hypothetical protein
MLLSGNGGRYQGRVAAQADDSGGRDGVGDWLIMIGDFHRNVLKVIRGRSQRSS